MPHETIRFEDFELDPGSFELHCAGHLVKLERIPLQLLFLLAENHQRLVTREEILQAIKDDPENPRFLRTIPGKGYRFVAPIERVVPEPMVADPPLSSPNTAQTSPPLYAPLIKPSLFKLKHALLICAVAILLVGA